MEEVDDGETSCARRYKYLAKKQQHFWQRWQREYLTDLRENNEGKNSDEGKNTQGRRCSVIVRGRCKERSLEDGSDRELNFRKDKEVRGANVRVMTKGKVVRLSRPV